MNAPSRLIAIKVAHTLVWALMAACVMGIPAVALRGRFGWAFALTGIILGECVVLALNKGKCPLTDWAAHFTEDRAENFDIYLPDWLARYNKTIFGTLFVVGEGILLWQWTR